MRAQRLEHAARRRRRARREDRGGRREPAGSIAERERPAAAAARDGRRPTSVARGGSRRRAGRSAFITARPAAVSRTTGRSPGVKSTQPAVTHRRRSAEQPGLGLLAQHAEGRRAVEAGAGQARIRLAAQELHRRLQAEAVVDARHGAQGLAHDERRPPRRSRPSWRASHTSQWPQPSSVSASSPK